MPITIDTSAKNLDDQIKQVNMSIALNKQVDAKYFSKSMTGNGKRKTGLFSTEADTISKFILNSRRFLDHVGANECQNKNLNRHIDHAFGNYFHQSTKEKEEDFKLFENNLTTMLPPVSLFHVLNDPAGIALSFPKDSAMYSLNALETVWTKITSGTIDGHKATTYAHPVIQAMRLYSRETPHQSATGVIMRDMQIAAQPDIYVLFATVFDDMDEKGDMIFTGVNTAHGKRVAPTQGVITLTTLREKSHTEYDWDQLDADLDDHLEKCIGNTAVKIPGVMPKQLALQIGDLSMYDLLTAQATIITHQGKDAILSYAKTLIQRTGELKAKSKKYPTLPSRMISALITFVQHLDLLNEIEDNLISTEMLASIYQMLKDGLHDKKEINNIARHSLRLLLSQRLHELEDIRNNDGLYKFEPKNAGVTALMQQNPAFSIQQRRIIMTQDPLVIGQAGAGSGKSHTLIGRLGYLRDQGEDLKNVLVLSFTNVAAININQRFPGVRSETLANMFHTIYNATYPGQSLSQPSTVANSARLLNPASQYFKNLGLDPTELEEFINEFATRLEQFDQTGFKRVNLQQELKKLSNLVENNLDMVACVLNAVEQTTLELEPIVIHHRLLSGAGELNIPQEYQDLNYIVTDESQDISTFEYILLLELTLHYRSQLLIIGDGSQTLYEFRNSDPRYMNALEASGVFVSHKLETNYRSNEEILMFANQFLQVIDANKYANIQLKSAKFSSPTLDSLHKAITVADNELLGTSLKDYTEDVKNFIREDKDFQKWFLSRVKKGEQVALMGWTRKEVIEAGEAIAEILKDHHLNIEITNIMSNNERPMTLLSRFAKAKNETLRALDPVNPTYVKDLERLTENFVARSFTRSSGKQSSFYNDFINRNVKTVLASPIWGAWIRDYRAGNLSKYQIGSNLIQQLLRLETRKNAMDQFLRKQKEVPNYDKCPIILSTIHGTKGLEFDHTVVLFNESKRGATSQESMRMMFVALSRAKTSEYIINSHRNAFNRSVTDTHAGMFQTPIGTAYMRTENDVRALVKTRNANAQNAPQKP